MQTQPIKSSPIASFYYLRTKEYYDFVLNVDIMVKNSERVGVAFRMKNEYNFYAFEISQKHGYKSLFRSVNGVYKLLEKINDGGIVQEQWYQVRRFQ